MTGKEYTQEYIETKDGGLKRKYGDGDNAREDDYNDILEDMAYKVIQNSKNVGTVMKLGERPTVEKKQKKQKTEKKKT